MKIHHIFIKMTAAAAMLLCVNTATAKGPPSDMTIVETALTVSGGIPFEFDDNPNDFDILVAAVVATDTHINVLNGENDYTVFAPDDRAFLALCEIVAGEPVPEGVCFGALADLLGVDGVAAVLAYHVTEGVRNSTSVTRARAIKMLDGNRISARGGFMDAANSDAGFVDTDIRVMDGMIHIIDFVLLPPTE
jgi:uncharacterized surface protein with fasciclin (FAS1) repeats